MKKVIKNTCYLAAAFAGALFITPAFADNNATLVTTNNDQPTVAQKAKTNAVDTKITAAVKAKILSANAKNELAGKNSVSVKTVNGVVKLTGCVSNKQDKLAVENLAKDTNDVSSVKNKLTVRANCK